MGGHGLPALGLRRRRIQLATAIAATLTVASLAHSEWQFHEPDHLAIDPGLVLAPQVASATTRNSILIKVSDPSGQPPGVLYTVDRISGNRMVKVCAGPAPLRCADPIPPEGQIASYSVSSTLAGTGTATTTIDVVARAKDDVVARAKAAPATGNRPYRRPSTGWDTSAAGRTSTGRTDDARRAGAAPSPSGSTALATSDSLSGSSGSTPQAASTRTGPTITSAASGQQQPEPPTTDSTATPTTDSTATPTTDSTATPTTDSTATSSVEAS